MCLYGSENKQRLFYHTALTDWFLVAFANLGKASSRPYACPHGTRLPPDGFSWNFEILVFFKNLSRNLTTIKGTLRENQYTFMSRSVLLSMRNISDKNYRENQNTHFMFNKLFLRNSCRFLDNVGEKKYCIAGQATDDNIVHVHCMLDT